MYIFRQNDVIIKDFVQNLKLLNKKMNYKTIQFFWKTKKRPISFLLKMNFN